MKDNVRNKSIISKLTGKIAPLLTILAFLSLLNIDFAHAKDEFQKGICLTTWSKNQYGGPDSDASLKALSKTRANWVSILTTWYQDKCSTTKIFPTDKTPTDDSIIHAIKTAHSLGLKVMIKPHLDVLDSSNGAWRGDISCSVEPEWQEWFENYKVFILHYAKIAQDNNVEMLCIGTELSSISPIKEDLWRNTIIKPVRETYKGLVTYAANWDDEYDQVKFWDAMDYVGIDAYFPLSDAPNPTLPELKKAWAPWLKSIEDFQAKVNKPIIFPEVGYCSADGAAKAPWEDIAGGKVNLDLQANCYKALLETFWDKKWFYGVYWWRWGTNVRIGGKHNRGFVPQNKPAQKVIEQWYKKTVYRKR